MLAISLFPWQNYITQKQKLMNAKMNIWTMIILIRWWWSRAVLLNVSISKDSDGTTFKVRLP
jgi:hypothetical protein